MPVGTEDNPRNRTTAPGSAAPKMYRDEGDPALHLSPLLSAPAELTHEIRNNPMRGI